jgi:hypothetical protein
MHFPVRFSLCPSFRFLLGLVGGQIILIAHHTLQSISTQIILIAHHTLQSISTQMSSLAYPSAQTICPHQ